MNQTYERKPLEATLKAVDEVLDANIPVTDGGKERAFTSTQKVAFLLLWRRCDWSDGRFYCRETRAVHRTRWVRGYLQKKLDLSERGARNLIHALQARDLLNISDDYPVVNPRRFILLAEDRKRRSGSRVPAVECRQLNAGSRVPAVECREDGSRVPESRQLSAAYSTSQPNQPIETQVDHTARESIEEKERRLESARQRQAEEYRRRESERQGFRRGLSKEFLASIYVKGDGR